jgi:DNA invertase Pin-like site-specific DNA recombinase
MVVVIFARGPSSNSLRDFAVRRGWQDELEVVTDVDALLRLVRLGRVGVVLCSSLNGLASSVPGLVQVLKEFISRKVVLIVPGAFDTSRMGKAFPDTLDAIEEFKRCVAEEAIQAGLSRARRRGVRLGRPMTRNAHYEDMARLRARGMTGRAIGRELGIPSSTAFKIISQLH